MAKKKIDPCRTGPRYLKFGTLQHNTVSTDDPCCGTAQIDNITMVSVGYQQIEAPAQESCTSTPPKKDTFRTASEDVDFNML